MSEAMLGELTGQEFGRQIVEATKAHVEKATAPLIARIEELERALGERPAGAQRAGGGMPASHIEGLMKGIAPVVRDYTAKSQGPVLARLEQLEKHQAGAVTGGVIDRSGHLILTLADGSQKDFGRVAANDLDPHDVARQIREQVEQIPKPRDGFGFDDLAVEHDGERCVVLRFTRGEHTKEFPLTLPVIIDRGIWREATAYAKGDAVTWAGSLWIAQREVSAGEKPDSGDAFRLSAKRGRDGKDAVIITKPPAEPLRAFPVSQPPPQPAAQPAPSPQ